MKSLRKHLSLLLVLVIVISGMTSCTKHAGQLIEDAEALCGMTPYTVDMQIKYESADAELGAVIDSFSAPWIKLSVDGDDMRARMDIKKDGEAAYIAYTVKDGDLYTEISAGGDVTVTKREKDEIDSETLVSEFGFGAGIGYDDFEKAEVNNAIKKQVILCTEIKDEPLEALVASLENVLSDMEAVVAIKDVNLAIQITDGRYDITILTVNYVITTPDDVYTLAMILTAQFDYEKEVNIVPPTVE